VKESRTYVGGPDVTTLRWVPQHRRDELRTLASRSRDVILLASLVGVLTGLLVAGFERLVVDVMLDHLLDLPPAILAAMPAAGLLASLAIRRFVGGGASPATADEYLDAFHDEDRQLGTRPFVARMLAALATLGSGVPMGLEGPSMYSGAFIGARIQHRLSRLARDADRRVLLTAGAAAGVAAIFKAPATGAVFALEVPYQDDLARRMLLPSLVAAATGYLVFAGINGTEPLFPIEGSSGFAFRDLGGAVLVGVVAGLGARAFAWSVRRAKRVQERGNPLLTTLAAGALLAGLFALGRLVSGESLVFGVGYRVVDWASQPGRDLTVLAAILLLRCLATATAVAGGAVGGLFVPLVVAGALAGAAIASVVSDADLSLFMVIGVAAFLGAGYRVPLAAVMFVAETTGRPSFVVPGVLAAVAAELVMGRSSITTHQHATEPVRADTE
jgi:chloride channel protein, CIC family